MSGHIDKHSGRVVTSPKDNILAESTSVFDAIEFTVKIKIMNGTGKFNICER